ncbi:MAG: ERF family protein [Syntrophales bacterium]|nr:ERF family protein [Syntrophales bacterium]
MTEEKAKYEVATKPETTPAMLLNLAIDKGADIEKLSQLMELQIKWEERESRKAYVLAVSKFKADPPDIYKDKINKQFGSKYSSIDALVNPTIPFLSKQGLSHSWDYGTTEGGWPSVTCILSHSCGYSQAVTMSAPPDISGGGSKNPIQQIKSTQTYLKIATFEAVTGLVSKEANLDDDGNASGDNYLDDKQLSTITDFVNAKNVNLPNFLKFMKAESLETILAKDYNKAVSALKAKKEPK